MPVPPIERLRALPPDELTATLLRQPEDQWFDRKSARADSRGLAKTLVAMANAEGGIIAVGLRDGKCEGVGGRPEERARWERMGIEQTAPAVHFETAALPCIAEGGEPDHLYVISVPPASRPHVRVPDDMYLRVADVDRLLTFAERTALLYERGEVAFEATPASRFGDTALDRKRCAAFARALGIRGVDRMLQARSLRDPEGGQFVAAQLLFGARPQWAYPAAHVRAIRYVGTERRFGVEQNTHADERFEGPLPRQLDEATKWIAGKMPERRALGGDGKFEWAPIIPEVVWREALVNAVVHRAYSNFGDHIRFEMFDDRVEVSNPGSFAAGRPKSDLREVVRMARNPRIARVLAEMSYGEERGEGLRRMYEVMVSSGREPPEIRYLEGAVRVILRAQVGGRERGRGLPPLALEIVGRLDEAGRLRTGELVELTGAARPTVLRALALLDRRGAVRHVAANRHDPNAYWTPADS